MCILKCILKHRILRKVRATFLSLSEEKRATSAGLKRLRRSRRPLAYSLHNVKQEIEVAVFFSLALLDLRNNFSLLINRCCWRADHAILIQDVEHRSELIFISARQ